MGFPSVIPTLVRYIVVSVRSARLSETMPMSNHITRCGRLASEKMLKIVLLWLLFMS